MKTNCVDQEQLFSYPPLELHFFPTQVLLSNSTFLKTERTQVGGLCSTATIKLVLQECARLPWRTKSPWATRGTAFLVEVRAGLHCTVNAHLILGSCSSVPTGCGYTGCAGCLTTGHPWHLHGCRSSQATRGEAFKAPEGQGGTHDKIGNMQKQQNL